MQKSKELQSISIELLFLLGFERDRSSVVSPIVEDEIDKSTSDVSPTCISLINVESINQVIDSLQKEFHRKYRSTLSIQ